MTTPAPGEPEPGEERPARPRTGFFLHVMPAVLYVVAIFYGGSVPNPEVPEVGALPFDKLAHFVAFAGMQIAILRAVRFELPQLGFKRQLLLAAGLTCVVGGALELYQLLFPQRSADFLDFLADAAGAITAAFVLWLVFGERYDEPA